MSERVVIGHGQDHLQCVHVHVCDVSENRCGLHHCWSSLLPVGDGTLLEGTGVDGCLR